MSVVEQNVNTGEKYILHLKILVKL